MGFFEDNQVYLVDMFCYKPPEELQMNTGKAIGVWRELKTYNEEVIHFYDKVRSRSGLSNSHTHLMKHTNPEHNRGKPLLGINEAMQEVELTLFGAVEGLIKKTKIKPTDVDILITCCSIFCSTPSLSAAIVNKFKMRQDIQSYHLGGMGCSMGVVSVNLIRDLLKARPNSVCMFATTEITSPAFYTGTDRSRMVTNLLFRIGGAAMLFTNKPTVKLQPKYKLKTAIRIHQGYVDAAYKCIQYSPDSEGINGIYLGKDVVAEASKGLEKVITQIAPKVLSYKQIAAFVLTEIGRRFNRRMKKYSPSFENCIDHVLIHAGGAKVLEGLGKNLKLSEEKLKPSYDVLFYYGNISSSTTWYTLSNIESLRGVKKGDKIMQVGVGSGLKCGVNLWVACRDIFETHLAWKQVANERGIKAEPIFESWTSRCLKLLLLGSLLLLVFFYLSQIEHPLVTQVFEKGLHNEF